MCLHPMNVCLDIFNSFFTSSCITEYGRMFFDKSFYLDGNETKYVIKYLLRLSGEDCMVNKFQKFKISIHKQQISSCVFHVLFTSSN